MNATFETLAMASMEVDVMIAAQILGKAGLPVFPCRPDKHPYTEHGYKDASTDQSQIIQWWDQYPVAMIGLPTGAVSGLVVVDVDIKGARNGFLFLQNRDAACTFATETPSGGMHFFYQHPGGKVKNSRSKIGDGIDIRGDGGYVIFPPSLGAIGSYNLALLSRISELPRWVCDTENEEIPEIIENNESIEAINISSILSSISVISTLSVSEVIEKTLPKQTGERNECIMNLARGLKFEAGLKNEPLPDIVPYVQRWHQLALPVIGTKSFMDTLSEFRYAWKNVRVPLTVNLLQMAIMLAEQYPPATPKCNALR